jgi:hypothetical protein
MARGFNIYSVELGFRPRRIHQDTEAAVKLELRLCSEPQFVSCNETQNSGAK